MIDCQESLEPMHESCVQKSRLNYPTFQVEDKIPSSIVMNWIPDLNPNTITERHQALRSDLAH